MSAHRLLSSLENGIHFAEAVKSPVRIETTEKVKQTICRYVCFVNYLIVFDVYLKRKYTYIIDKSMFSFLRTGLESPGGELAEIAALCISWSILRV